MPEPLKQQLAEAIIKTITPLVRTGDGIDSSALEQFGLDCAGEILDGLDLAFQLGSIPKAHETKA